MRLARTVLLAGVMASLATAGALAAGGGGGSGGGEMPSASGPMYDPAKEYEKAVKALEAKDYKNAARAAQHVTEAAPKMVEGWQILGMASAAAENWKTARRAYERA